MRLSHKSILRFIGSQSLNSFELLRSILARAYFGYARISVHLTTSCIHKSLQGSPYLDDCSMTTSGLHRVAGVLVATMVLTESN